MGEGGRGEWGLRLEAGEDVISLDSHGNWCSQLGNAKFKMKSAKYGDGGLRGCWILWIEPWI
jgi:hypothetical protein